VAISRASIEFGSGGAVWAPRTGIPAVPVGGLTPNEVASVGGTGRVAVSVGAGAGGGGPAGARVGAPASSAPSTLAGKSRPAMTGASAVAAVPSPESSAKRT
jgi:hypothetical protein